MATVAAEQDLECCVEFAVDVATVRVAEYRASTVEVAVVQIVPEATQVPEMSGTLSAVMWYSAYIPAGFHSQEAAAEAVAMKAAMALR